MMSYWTEHDPPMSFIPEGWTYEQKREFRFACIPYLERELWDDCGDRWEGRSVLCVGDGAGIDALEFARHGAVVTVVDLSEKAIAITKKHVEEARALPRHRFEHRDVIDVRAQVADACALPFFSEQFDFVYSFGVIHHVPAVHRAVSEVARVLKRGGAFIGMVYNRDSLLFAHSILKRGYDEGVAPERAMRAYSERNPDCPHSIAYTREGLSTLLCACGLSSTSIKTRYDVIDLPNKRKVPFRVEGVSDLGWHLFFEAKK